MEGGVHVCMGMCEMDGGVHVCMGMCEREVKKLLGDVSDPSPHWSFRVGWLPISYPSLMLTAGWASVWHFFHNGTLQQGSVWYGTCVPIPTMLCFWACCQGEFYVVCILGQSLSAICPCLPLDHKHPTNVHIGPNDVCLSTPVIQLSWVGFVGQPVPLAWSCILLAQS